MSGVKTLRGANEAALFKDGFEKQKLLQGWAVPHGSRPPNEERLLRRKVRLPFHLTLEKNSVKFPKLPSPEFCGALFACK